MISRWDDNEATDIVDAHNYRVAFARWDRQTELNPVKGCVFTEAAARWYAPRPCNGEPCEVIHWPPAGIDGGSFRQLFEQGNDGKVQRGTEPLIFHFPWYDKLPMSAIRLGDYKLVKTTHSPQGEE